MEQDPVIVPVDTEIMKSRQAWFWRRTTLQLTLVALVAMLFFSIAKTAALENDWPTVVVQCSLIAAVAWLVTMYFAMVDNADKLASAARAIGDGVGAART